MGTCPHCGATLTKIKVFDNSVWDGFWENEQWRYVKLSSKLNFACPACLTTIYEGIAEEESARELVK